MLFVPAVDFLTEISSSASFPSMCRRHHQRRRRNRRRCCCPSLLSSLEAIVALTVLVGAGVAVGAAEVDIVGGPLRYVIKEQCDHGTVIGDLTVDAGLRRRYPDEVLSQLEFRIMSPPPLPFTVDLKSGVIRTGGVIDRDSLMQCKDRDLCEVSIDVTVRPTQFFRIIKTVVQVDDINDNGPYFRDHQMSISIRESAAIDTSFSLPLANDLDSPKYGVVAYELVTDTADLGLKVMDRGGRLMDVRLVVQKELDREVRDAYRLQMVAYDGGPTPKSAQIDIFVHVLDSNDHSPVFERSSYAVNITENIAPGTVIVRVRATDKDIGQNAEIVYGFSGQTQGMYGHLFSIRNRTGEISVIGDIDYEQSAIYQLAVIAEDGGADAMPTDAAVVIRVLDLNDNAPAIVVSTLTARRTNDVAEVSENLAPGTFVAHVSVLDRDSGDFGRVACNISDPAFGLVERYRTELQVVTATTFDRETKDLYDDVRLVCWDGGLPPLTAEKLIPVRIADGNDHAPQFLHASYTGRIAENSPPEVAILQVKAVDKDIGSNGVFHYALLGASDASFDVNYDGTVVAKAAVDRERHSSFRLTVLAIDHGAPALTGSAVVVVMVDDVNDETPTFGRSSYAFSVAENQPDGVQVGRVVAEDRDLVSPSSPEENRIRYSFSGSGHVTSDAFAIDPETGDIVTTATLDRESRSVYRLTVQAVDRGDAPLTGTALVTVYVQDENDNAPSFQFPSSWNDTVTVSSRLPLGHAVATVTASDPDLDRNGRVTYRIHAGNENGAFTIDPQKGVVTINIRLDHIDYQEYQLVVFASDGASPSRTSESTLRIQVNSSVPYLAPKRTDHVAPPGNYGNHLLIVVLLVCGSAAATVTLLVLIVVVWRRRYRHKKSQRYKCRMEALRALTAKELVGSSGSVAEITPLTTIVGPQFVGQPSNSTIGDGKALCNGDIVSYQTRPVLPEPSASDGEHDAFPSSHTSNADSGNGHSEEEDPDRLRLAIASSSSSSSFLPPQTRPPHPPHPSRDFRFDLPPPPPPLLLTTFFAGRLATTTEERGSTLPSTSPPLVSLSTRHPHLPPSRSCSRRLPSFTPSPESPRRWGRFCSPSSLLSGGPPSSTLPVAASASIRSPRFPTWQTVTEVGEAKPDVGHGDPVTNGCDDDVIV